MTFGFLEKMSNPVYRNRFLITAGVTVLVFALNIIGLMVGITTILPQLLYIPIILTGYWYPRSGIILSVAIAVLYGALTVAFPVLEPLGEIATFSRMALFVMMGVVIALLSSRLTESEQQLSDIIDFLPDATFAIDGEGRIIAWNRAIEEMTGRTKAEMLFRDDYVYALPFYGERRPMLAGLLLKNEGNPIEKYPTIRKESGNLVSEAYFPAFNGGRGAHLRFSARALVDSEGRINGAIESIRDVTDSVMKETALRNTGHRLNTLAGIIRHDMSARLSILYGHLRLGVMKFNDPEVISFIASLESAANSMKRQIEVSREFREIGTMPPGWVPVQGAVQDAVSRLDPGRVALRAWTERLEVFSDPHLPTVFYQILHNALKEEVGARKIVVTYQIVQNGCAIIIEDDGIGIRDGEKSQLFLQQEDSYGRGLFLAHEILAITGMTIRETGKYTKGARFEILVPSEGYRVEGVAS